MSNLLGREQQENVAQSVQNIEAIINEGLRVALLEKTPDQSLEVLLEYLGKALDGERTYIFEQNESGGDDNTYEWVAEESGQRRRIFKIFLQKCARTGTGISASVNISL